MMGEDNWFVWSRPDVQRGASDVERRSDERTQRQSGSRSFWSSAPACDTVDSDAPHRYAEAASQEM